jgi:GDPmannose 4,6-dehydratase
VSRTHLITGVGGQDGVLLARQLVARGDRVTGTVPPGTEAPTPALLTDVEIVEHDARDAASFDRLLTDLRPDVVHNLAALSSVAESWEATTEAREVNQSAVEEMLDVLRARSDRAPQFVHASTSDIFGTADGPGSLVDEATRLAPLSPYGEAKAAAHLAVQRARDDGLRATNLILFGHTSVLQAAHFVLPTVASQAAEVAFGTKEAITLRDPTVRRDWGSAPDFVRAFVQAAGASAGDFVIGTGVLHSLAEIAGWALEAAGAPGDALLASGEPPRGADIDGLRADPAAAARLLHWAPAITLRAEIRHMVAVAVRRLESGPEFPELLRGEVS